MLNSFELFLNNKNILMEDRFCTFIALFLDTL